MSHDWPKCIALISFPFVIILWFDMDMWPHVANETQEEDVVGPLKHFLLW